MKPRAPSILSLSIWAVLKLVKFEARKMGWIGFVRVDGVVKDVPGALAACKAAFVKHCWSLAMTDIVNTNMDRCFGIIGNG